MCVLEKKSIRLSSVLRCSSMLCVTGLNWLISWMKSIFFVMFRCVIGVFELRWFVFDWRCFPVVDCSERIMLLWF